MESSCIYCGCGCRLDYEVKNGKILKVRGVKSDEMSDGAPCIKGLTIHEVYDKNRISKPTINGKEVTLKKALDYVYNKTKSLAPTELFFNTSGKITNEDNYVLEKFARECYNTPNIDSCCGRLCHIATVMGMNNIFGTPNRTLVKNVDKIDTLLIFGSEPEKNYPVFYNKLLRKKDLKIIRVHSFLKGGNEREKIITIRPSSETCLLNGVMNELIKKGAKSKVEGFSLLKEKTSKYSEKMVCSNSALSKKDYKTLVNYIRKSKKLGIFHGMGITQHVNSLENVHSLLNLALLKDALILTLRGEVNVQGAGDIIGSSFKGPISRKGLNIIEALMLSPAKAVFLTAFDPLKSMPDTEQLKNKLKKAFKVYFGAYNNDTSRAADVVIPIASLLESEGTITNGERRIRKVSKVINGAPQLWEVMNEFSKKFKKTEQFDYKDSKEVFNELKKKVKAYSQVNTNDLWRGLDAWPDKSVKHERFMPEDFDGLSDVTTNKYPFILTTYRSKHSFLSNEVTKNSETLTKLREPAGFYLNPSDMKKLGVKQGMKVVVTSLVNSLTGKAYSSDRMPSGIIGAYMHYSELPINKLFPLKFDEESFTPNYKNVAVNVETL